jgi:hypothetical protein
MALLDFFFTRKSTGLLLKDFATHGETLRARSAEDYEVENLEYLFRTKKLAATNFWKKTLNDVKPGA